MAVSSNKRIEPGGGGGPNSRYIRRAAGAFNPLGVDLFGDPILPPGVGELAKRYGVPPFSVLNAREGDWQDRKRAWISLGIQSEVGRGTSRPHGPDARPDTEYKFGPGAEKYSGGDAWRGRGRANATPSGSPFPAADYSNGERGDGRGRAMGRVLGQDLMRGENPNFGGDAEGVEATGTSIFDPVLCEIVYDWFGVPGGLVLDPFAGGSVRGIVAAKMGMAYYGIELREEQVAANREQYAAIIGNAAAPAAGGTVPVKVSAACARLLFNGCEPEYIRDVCKASCCQSSVSDSGTMITIHESEAARIAERGGIVRDGMLESVGGRCPFKTSAELCALHGTDDKPFGCVASPFTLNQSGTLIVRNRYKLLKCYDDGRRIPAYKAFRASLDRLFGESESARICEALDAGGGDVAAEMPRDAYEMLRDNDGAKRAILGRGFGGLATAPAPAPGAAVWAVGDSRELAAAAPECDLVFSCPPYGDLERYSDDPRDVSTFDYADFIAAIRKVVADCAGRLKPGGFAAFVVGDFRDRKSGEMRGFVPDTVAAFRAAGLLYWNEIILLTAVGSLPVRCARAFEASRKVGKTHQNLLVFRKPV